MCESLAHAAEIDVGRWYCNYDKIIYKYSDDMKLSGQINVTFYFSNKSTTEACMVHSTVQMKYLKMMLKRPLINKLGECNHTISQFSFFASGKSRGSQKIGKGRQGHRQN